jgi:hypothetical protein
MNRVVEMIKHLANQILRMNNPYTYRKEGPLKPIYLLQRVPQQTKINR